MLFFGLHPQLAKRTEHRHCGPQPTQTDAVLSTRHLPWRLVVVLSLAVVSNQLEASNHLSYGEKAKDLCEQNTTTNNLCGGDVSQSLDGRRRGSGSAGGGRLQQGTGVLQGGEGSVEIVLESGDGTVARNKS